jgi:hypothetical protein
MSTKTPIAPTDELDALPSVFEAPDVKKEFARLETLARQQVEIENAIRAGRAQTDAVARGEAAVAEHRLLLELTKKKLEVEQQQRICVEAKEREVERRRELIAAAKRHLLQRELVSNLRRAAASMRKLQQLEIAEHNLVGAGMDRLSWPILGTNDDGGSFLDEWIARAQELGLLDGEEV